jgi:hypothetical protein
MYYVQNPLIGILYVALYLFVSPVLWYTSPVLWYASLLLWYASPVSYNVSPDIHYAPCFVIPFGDVLYHRYFLNNTFSFLYCGMYHRSVTTFHSQKCVSVKVQFFCLYTIMCRPTKHHVTLNHTL